MNAHQKPASEITTFNFEGHDLRVEERSGKPWFFATDVCDCLELTNASKAVSVLDEDEKGLTKSYTLGGSQDQLLVSEGGLYTLVLRSRKATTPGTVQHRFRKWVTGEVIPAIRTTGAYVGDGVTVSNLDEATRKAIGGMIKRNAGVVIREALEPVQAELHHAQQELASLKRQIESPQTCTAADIWDHYNFGPMRGGTVWLGNRLIEMGCMPEFGASERRGNQSRRKFDIAKSHIAMKNGLKLHADRYIAERQGQGKFDLKGK